MTIPTSKRFLLKAILLPVRVTASVLAGAIRFISNSFIINKIFSLASGLFFLGFLALTWSAIFVQQDMPLLVRILMPCTALIASYITSPQTGVLKYSRLLAECIDGIGTSISHRANRINNHMKKI